MEHMWVKIKMNNCYWCELNHFRISIAKSSVSLSKSIKILPYNFIYFLVLKFIGLNRKRVWFRNSLALNYWQFALSDVDLSIMAKDLDQAIATSIVLKDLRWLLLGGEVQVYREDSVAQFIESGNVYEIQRDPILCKYLDFSREGSDYEKAFFIFKSLLSDKQISLYPELRQEKWKSHFRLIGKEMDFFANKENLINFFCSYDFIKNDMSPNQLAICLDPKSRESADIYPFLFSNQIAWVSDDSESYIRLVKEASLEINEFIHCSIMWEVWGLYPMAQLFIESNFSQIFDHLQNQHALLSILKIDEEKKEKTSKVLDLLIEQYKKIQEKLYA
jgi:hypothetical protein